VSVESCIQSLQTRIIAVEAQGNCCLSSSGLSADISFVRRQLLWHKGQPLTTQFEDIVLFAHAIQFQSSTSVQTDYLCCTCSSLPPRPITHKHSLQQLFTYSTYQPFTIHYNYRSHNRQKRPAETTSNFSSAQQPQLFSNSNQPFPPQLHLDTTATTTSASSSSKFDLDIKSLFL
jgi:hypothetical protein